MPCLAAATTVHSHSSTRGHSILRQEPARRLRPESPNSGDGMPYHAEDSGGPGQRPLMLAQDVRELVGRPGLGNYTGKLKWDRLRVFAPSADFPHTPAQPAASVPARVVIWRWVVCGRAVQGLVEKDIMRTHIVVWPFFLLCLAAAPLARAEVIVRDPLVSNAELSRADADAASASSQLASVRTVASVLKVDRSSTSARRPPESSNSRLGTARGGSAWRFCAQRRGLDDQNPRAPSPGRHD